MDIKYSKSAVKFINSMDKPTKKRIREGIEGLTKNPPIGDIKQMQGYKIPCFRLRIGKYRIIYKYLSNNVFFEILFIMDIGSRGNIYKEMR